MTLKFANFIHNCNSNKKLCNEMYTSFGTIHYLCFKCKPANDSDCFLNDLPVDDESEMWNEFKCVKVRKACGPDGVKQKNT